MSYIEKVYKVRTYRITAKFYKDEHNNKWYFRGLKELYILPFQHERPDVADMLYSGTLTVETLFNEQKRESKYYKDDSDILIKQMAEWKLTDNSIKQKYS